VTLGAGKENLNGLSFGVILQALASTSQANLLSTPSIITMDNQESEIVVGQNVPFRTGQTATGTDGTTNPFTTIERKDVGLTLRVTPSISEGELVRLDIEQESSSIAPSNEAASDLITNTRQIKTSVLADDGETIVLGGLMNEEFTQSVSKVPLLGDIPWLGALFRSTKNQKVKRNLLVFLRPTIVRDKADASKVSHERYDGLWELHLDIQKEAHGEEEANALEKPEMETLYKRNRLIQPAPRLVP
ncbi:MAG: type II secretion system protein GspD, partial [Gammaproteobacteria bacterium]